MIDITKPLQAQRINAVWEDVEYLGPAVYPSCDYAPTHYVRFADGRCVAFSETANGVCLRNKPAELREWYVNEYAGGFGALYDTRKMAEDAQGHRDAQGHIDVSVPVIRVREVLE